MSHTIAFVGAGKMVSAIVHGLLRTNSFSENQISCCSAKDGTSEKLAQSTGISRFDSVEELLAQSPSILVLGCKPQQIKDLPESISKSSTGCLVLQSWLVSTKDIRGIPSRNLVHSMPSRGQIGHGITSYLFAQFPSNEDRKIIEKSFSLGSVYELREEEDLDRITAIGKVDSHMFLSLPVP